MELKSCPFCGGKAELRMREEFAEGCQWPVYQGEEVRCTECDVMVFEYNCYEYIKEEVEKARGIVIEKWNSRVS